MGPRKAAAAAAVLCKSPGDAQKWMESARVAALVGSCGRSLGSVVSGLRAWEDFCTCDLKLGGPFLPPTVNQLLAWSRIFCNVKVFSNYVGYVRFACELLELPLDAFWHPSVRRAKSAVKKRRLAMPRAPLFVRIEHMQAMMGKLLTQPNLRDMAMLFLSSYVFLLRVPSECLSVCTHSCENCIEAPVVKVGTTAITWQWLYRKHTLYPSHAIRVCWCRYCSLTCPVHVLGCYFSQFAAGDRPFAHIRAGQATLALRVMLNELGVVPAERYVLHDLRRGHADDIRRSGAPALDIYRAGDWHGASIFRYLDQPDLERHLVAEAHAVQIDNDNSSDESS